MASITEDTFSVTRTTRTIPKPYADVLARLNASIQRPDARVSGFEILQHLSSPAAFEAATDAALGPHGFMHFASITHGPWLHLYGLHAGKQVTRVVFGNPQVAVTMLRHDVRAGLFAPVEALLVEREDGKGTDVVQVKPSTLIAGDGKASEELLAAARKLDEKLDALWEFVAGDDLVAK